MFNYITNKKQTCDCVCSFLSKIYTAAYHNLLICLLFILLTHLKILLRHHTVPNSTNLDICVFRCGRASAYSLKSILMAFLYVIHDLTVRKKYARINKLQRLQEKPRIKAKGVSNRNALQKSIPFLSQTVGKTIDGRHNSNVAHFTLLNLTYCRSTRFSLSCRNCLVSALINIPNRQHSICRLRCSV